MGHDELFQRISVDLGLNNAFIGLKMSSKLNDLPEHFTPRPELQVTFNEIDQEPTWIDAGFHQLNQNMATDCHWIYNFRNSNSFFMLLK